MQARNQTRQTSHYTASAENRDWLLATEDELFESQEEILPPAQENEFPARREKRERVFRVAEYSLYPRMERNQRRLTAFVRNESLSGMCLVSDRNESVGSWLRVGVQAVDGSPTKDTLARVVWTCEQPDGRHWLGLSLMESQSAQQPEVLCAKTNKIRPGSTLETPDFTLITRRLQRKAS